MADKTTKPETAAEKAPVDLAESGLIRSFDLDATERHYGFEMPDDTVLVAKMKWPEPESVRNLYQQSDVRFEEQEGRRRILVRHPQHVFEFFAAHFLGLTDASGEPIKPAGKDEQLELIRSNIDWQVPQAILWGGMFFLRSPRAAAVVNREGPVDLAALSGRKRTRLETRAFDFSVGTHVTYPLEPEFAKLPAAVSEKYFAAAQNRVFDERRSVWTVTQDVRVIDEIGRTYLQSLKGATFKGKPAEAGNRADWIESVHYSLFAEGLERIHSGARAGNV